MVCVPSVAVFCAPWYFGCDTAPLPRMWLTHTVRASLSLEDVCSLLGHCRFFGFQAFLFPLLIRRIDVGETFLFFQLILNNQLSASQKLWFPVSAYSILCLQTTSKPLSVMQCEVFPLSFQLICDCNLLFSGINYTVSVSPLKDGCINIPPLLYMPSWSGFMFTEV